MADTVITGKAAATVLTRTTFNIGRQGRHRMASSIVSGVALFAAAMALAHCSNGASDPHIAYCRKLLDHMMKSPATIKVIESSSALEDTHIVYDANNSFGVPVRGRIDCWYQQPAEKPGERAILTKVWLDFQPVPELGVLGARTAMLSDPGSASDPEYKPDGAEPTAMARKGWIVMNPTSSPMDGSALASLRLTANGPVKGWPSKEFTPMLVVRCKERKTQVFMVTGMAAVTDYGELYRTTVRLRFDDGKPERQGWSESTDREALFASNSTALARRLAKTKTFRVEFTPFNASPQVAEFSIADLRQKLDTVAKPCGWKL